MRIELLRTFPGDAKKAYDFLADYRTWPAWYTGVMEILDPDNAAWDGPGDKVRFAHRLLGRRLEVELTLHEVREAEYVKCTGTAAMVGGFTQEWIYGDAGEGAFTLKVVMETEGPTNWFGKAIDRLVIPQILERDLRHTFDHLGAIFTMGIPA